MFDLFTAFTQILMVSGPVNDIQQSVLSLIIHQLPEHNTIQIPVDGIPGFMFNGYAIIKTNKEFLRFVV